MRRSSVDTIPALTSRNFSRSSDATSPVARRDASSCSRAVRSAVNVAACLSRPLRCAEVPLNGRAPTDSRSPSARSRRIESAISRAAATSSRARSMRSSDGSMPTSCVRPASTCSHAARFSCAARAAYLYPSLREALARPLRIRAAASATGSTDTGYRRIQESLPTRSPSLARVESSSYVWPQTGHVSPRWWSASSARVRSDSRCSVCAICSRRRCAACSCAAASSCETACRAVSAARSASSCGIGSCGIATGRSRWSIKRSKAAARRSSLRCRALERRGFGRDFARSGQQPVRLSGVITSGCFADPASNVVLARDVGLQRTQTCDALLQPGELCS